MKAPKAKKIAKEFNIHNDIRIDNYYWLNNRENPEVINYLKEENTYTDHIMKPTEQLQKKLFEEIKGRIKEDDESVPYKSNGYWYISRYKKGNEYPIYIRKKENLDAKEEIIFDLNEMAKGHSYYKLGYTTSPNNKLAIFATDTVSRRIYNLQIKNLETGEILNDFISGTSGDCVWSQDNKTFFYVTKDPETLRPSKVFKHVLGKKQKEDILIYEEKDPTFDVYLFKTKSKKYIGIGSHSTLSNEYRFIPSNNPDSEWIIFQKREKNLEYSFDHFEDFFYIRTNKDGAFNFKLMRAPINKTEKENWEEVIKHRENVLLEDFELFESYLVTEEKENGLTHIQIKSWNNEINYELPLDEEVYSIGMTINLDFKTDILRYSYSSMTTPSSVINFNMRTKEKTILKEEEVLGGKFDKNNYTTKRIWATARDGAKVPISLVMAKKTTTSPNTPLLLYAYGSYGYSIDPDFSSARLSLLDRGFIYAIAHVRGGEELGRPWYEDGKMLHKKNTFFDFIDCAKFLIEQNHTSSKHLYANGGSAGGLLMGAVVNYEPKLFNGVVADVPFVDVVTTMLDDSIPLTTGEYDEWGNPNEKKYYEYIKSYSPYDNVEAKEYPNILVTTGLHDSQVQYWEPAKWVAKLRDFKTDYNILLLKTNMESGHGGASGRFESLKEIALEYAFYLFLEKIYN